MIDLSIKRRRYFSNEYSLLNCPECGLELVDDSCSVLLKVKSDTDEVETMTSMSGSHFCADCPVVVFDVLLLERVAKLSIQGSEELWYAVQGIVNMAAIPNDKKHLPIGAKENPVPLVKFLPNLNENVKSSE